MNWQEELKKKAEQLNLKEDKDDVSTQTDSGFRLGSGSGRGRNVDLPKLYKKIIKKGGKGMISAEAAKGDILKLIDKAKELSKQENILVAYSLGAVIILEAILVAIKVILTTRTNTAKIMKKLEIPLEEKGIEKKEETK